MNANKAEIPDRLPERVSKRCPQQDECHDNNAASQLEQDKANYSPQPFLKHGSHYSKDNLLAGIMNRGKRVGHGCTQQRQATNAYQEALFTGVAQSPAKQNQNAVQQQPAKNFQEHGVGYIAPGVFRLLRYIAGELLVEPEFNGEPDKRNKGEREV